MVLWMVLRMVLYWIGWYRWSYRWSYIGLGGIGNPTHDFGNEVAWSSIRPFTTNKITKRISPASQPMSLTSTKKKKLTYNIAIIHIACDILQFFNSDFHVLSGKRFLDFDSFWMFPTRKIIGMIEKCCIFISIFYDLEVINYSIIHFISESFISFYHIISAQILRIKVQHFLIISESFVSFYLHKFTDKSAAHFLQWCLTLWMFINSLFLLLLFCAKWIFRCQRSDDNKDNSCRVSHRWHSVCIPGRSIVDANQSPNITSAKWRGYTFQWPNFRKKKNESS